MKFLKRLFVIIIVIVAIVVAFLWYIGYFAPVKIVEKEMSSMEIVYEDYVGEYQNVGAVQDSLYKLLVSQGINTKRGIGIYFDDPKKVDPKQCRSKVGSIIEGENLNKIEVIKSNHKVMTLKKGNYMVVEFPFKNEMSILAGVIKVYPALNEYVVENNYEMSQTVEIYDIDNKVILYCVEIIN